jgi:hypothetical protein
MGKATHGSTASKKKPVKPKANKDATPANTGSKSDRKRKGTADGPSVPKKDAATADDDVEDVLRREILALGGDESDVQLLEDVDESSDADSDEDESAQDVSACSCTVLRKACYSLLWM